MPKEKPIVAEGTVIESLPNVMFKVELDINESIVLCTLSGKMQKYFIKVLPGDNVRIEMSPYDLTRGRIVARLRNEDIQNNENLNNKKKNKKKK